VEEQDEEDLSHRSCAAYDVKFRIDARQLSLAEMSACNCARLRKDDVRLTTDNQQAVFEQNRYFAPARKNLRAFEPFTVKSRSQFPAVT